MEHETQLAQTQPSELQKSAITQAGAWAELQKDGNVVHKQINPPSQ